MERISKFVGSAEFKQGANELAYIEVAFFLSTLLMKTFFTRSSWKTLGTFSLTQGAGTLVIWKGKGRFRKWEKTIKNPESAQAARGIYYLAFLFLPAMVGRELCGRFFEKIGFWQMCRYGTFNLSVGGLALYTQGRSRLKRQVLPAP